MTLHYKTQGVANRDIKLENTLLDSTTRPLIKICDFGYSKVQLTYALMKRIMYTPMYTSIYFSAET